MFRFSLAILRPILSNQHHKLVNRFIPLHDALERQKQLIKLLSSSSSSGQSNDSIIVTDRCLKRIENILNQHELLRIGVRGGGCSGFEYEFSIDYRNNYKPNEDRLFSNRIVIDCESLEYMLGSKIDYEDELIRSGFCVRDNPQADSNCSCGVSFSLKMDDIFADVQKK